MPTVYKKGDYPTSIIGEYIDFECEVYGETGELIALYVKAPRGIHQLAKEITKGTKPQKSARTTHGVPQLSTVYGCLPRIAIREDYCRFSKQTKNEKGNAEKAFKLNEMLSEYYKKTLPEQFSLAIKRVESEVLPDYRLVETPWTNININLNQVIKYHCDSGNNKDDLSNVLIVKENTLGGHLACPEYNFTLAQDDGFMVFFKGQEILHGVTPCRFIGENAYRSSIVNYTLNNLKHCYPYEEELKRLKTVKSNQALNKKQKTKELRAYLERARAKK